jgi:superoxide reductase
MAERLQVFKCNECGQIVLVLRGGGGSLVCCNKLMVQQKENITDAAVEKHVPVVERVEGGCRVRVGSVAHPMTAEHYIEWIEWTAGNRVARVFLAPGDAPEAVFKVDAETVNVRAYCNLHGLWKG